MDRSARKSAPNQSRGIGHRMVPCCDFWVVTTRYSMKGEGMSR